MVTKAVMETFNLRNRVILLDHYKLTALGSIVCQLLNSSVSSDPSVFSHIHTEIKVATQGYLVMIGSHAFKACYIIIMP